VHAPNATFSILSILEKGSNILLDILRHGEFGEDSLGVSVKVFLSETLNVLDGGRGRVVRDSHGSDVTNFFRYISAFEIFLELFVRVTDRLLKKLVLIVEDTADGSKS
jgi:hypothetical protein